MEVWDYDAENNDELIDRFTFQIFNSLISFSQSHPITVPGMYGIGRLTLRYGNLTTDSTSCNPAVQPTYITILHIPEGKLYLKTLYMKL